MASLRNVNAMYGIGTRSVTFENQPIGMYTTAGCVRALRQPWYYIQVSGSCQVCLYECAVSDTVVEVRFDCGCRPAACVNVLYITIINYEPKSCITHTNAFSPLNCEPLGHKFRGVACSRMLYKYMCAGIPNWNAMLSIVSPYYKVLVLTSPRCDPEILGHRLEGESE